MRATRRASSSSSCRGSSARATSSTSTGDGCASSRACSRRTRASNASRARSSGCTYPPPRTCPSCATTRRRWRAVTDRDQQKALMRLRRRMRLVLAAFALAFVGLAARAVHLQVFDEQFLTEQGEARHLRVEQIAAHRGTITDRNGEPLAVSTPVDSVWANPRELAESGADPTELAHVLELDKAEMLRKITRSTGRNFIYLRRHMSPAAAERVAALHVPGVYLQREYRRYYPAGEIVGHLLGFTDVDDRGLEGLELAFDDWLAGTPGAKRVLRDRFGRSVEDVEGIEAPSPGRTLTTSIDLPIQYLAYRALKSAVLENGARSGSVVVLDVTTGEVLAIANQPGFNPNDREQYTAS